MMHPPTETRRSSHLSRMPLIALGPGGDFTEDLYIQGSQLVCAVEPAPPAPALVRPTARKVPATAAPRQPWRWSHVWMGFALAFVIMLLLVAFLFALVLTPIVFGWRHR